ncbi:MAG: PAS domain-containing protein [Candidatus Omnitrophica bacterium]|nr:PAS domain-containing protein [Candidatus Omnitrophota bacterium]
MMTQEDLLRRVVFCSPNYLFWKNRQNVYAGCNEGFAKLCGVVDAEDVVGKVDLALAWPREQAEAFIKTDLAVMESGQALLDHEEMCVGNTSKRMCVLASRVPLSDDKGRVIGLVGMFVDITEGNQREFALGEELFDLKRFKELSFDREIRMIALKKEVNALAQALGRPVVYDLSFL